jgi:CRISPR-associated endonuclease/helicase Cas3
MQAPPLAWWGKARPQRDGWLAAPYHPLAWHSLDVAAAGTVLLQRMPALRHLLAQRLRLSETQALDWVAFWLALHDLGKFAESFQSQCPDLFKVLRGREPDPAKPYTSLHHDSLGMLFWKDVLRERMVDEAWFGDNSSDLADGLDFWARACTGHHGQPPTEGGFWGQHFDTREDRAAAMAFVDAAREIFLDAELAAAISAQEPVAFLRSSQELSWWLSGLAVLADWLGSNTDWFR